MNRVLLVDDDVELASMLREYIEREGFAADAQFNFGFFLHGRKIQERLRSREKVWLPRPCSVQDSPPRRAARVYSAAQIAL